MKLQHKIIILCCSFYLKAATQNNLVPNFSFENYSSCPVSYALLYYGVPWFNANTTSYGTPDLFNTCVPTGAGDQTTVPTNSFGNQMPRTGNGYAGIACVIDTMNVREYIEVPLDSALVGGQKYCVEFYVSLGDVSSLATSNIGAYFSVDSLLDSTQGNAINVIPQVANSTSVILSDKINWMKIFGVFTAQGGEKFMTIGNFLSPANTVVQNVGGSYLYAYYYIDDISVTACDTTWVGVNETVKNEDGFKVYPNPASSIISVESSKYQVQSIRIMDVLGREIYYLQTTNNKTEIDVSHLPSGMYILQVQSKSGVVSKKFVKE
jgi:hypothetical protein